MATKKHRIIESKVVCPSCRCRVNEDYTVFIEALKAIRCVGCLKNLTISNVMSYRPLVRNYLINQI